MKQKLKNLSVLIAGSFSLLATSVGAIYAAARQNQPSSQVELIRQGQQVFRYDTFGDEIHWTDQLHMDKVISTVSRRWFLEAAVEGDWVLVLVHEPGNPVRRVTRDGKGWYQLVAAEDEP